MLKSLLVRKLDFVLIFIFACLLLVVRGFEDFLFYDPFLNFFRKEFQVNTLPNFDFCKLLLSYAFRFFINSALSIGIIYLFFKDLALAKFTALLYLLLFFILISIFFAILFLKLNDSLLELFYIRRFIIQPLFLLLFLPGFYYQRLVSLKK